MADPKTPTSLLQPVLPTAAFVFNHDLCGIVTRLNRFITELIRSNSSNVSTTTGADSTRALSYLNSVDKYLDWVMSQPQLDLPQTSHNAPWPVWPVEPVPTIENEDIEDLLRMFLVAHAEMVVCESSRMASGLSKFDETRLRLIVTKARNFLENYVSKVSPIDLPASSPMETVTPPAR